MPTLTRDTRKLLSTVGGKPHATHEDHEEPRQSPRKEKAVKGKLHTRSHDPALSSVPQRKATKQTASEVLSMLEKHKKEAEDEQSIYADPLSDDDLQPPPASKPTGNVLDEIERLRREEEDRPKPDNALKKPPPRSSNLSNPQMFIQQKETNSVLNTAPSTTPGRASKRKRADVRPPRSGSYQTGQAHKAQKGFEGDKEDATTSQPSGKESGNDDIGAIFDDMAFGSSSVKKQKTTFSTKDRTPNIHATAAKKRNNGYGRKSKLSGKINHTPGVEVDSEKDDESDSDISIKDSYEYAKTGSQAENHVTNVESCLKAVGTKFPRATKSSALKDNELNLPVPRSRRSTPSSNSAQLLNQLGEWKQEQSSPPSSSVPQEELDKMEAYVAELKEIPEVTQCMLCKMPVNENVYADFWYGKKTTVKNQTAFCTTHKRISANDEYECAGYPKIDWDALPRRIKKHRKELYRVLTNERGSRYRDRYEPIALTGKAGAIRSRRKDRPQDGQDEDMSFVLDDCNTFPGYYGPRGRRSMTETIMKELRNEIKSCTDAVVQTSGPAAFVQAVLVPEVAVLLIMEDCMVDNVEAEQIRENTYDMGLVLHEEIEDEVHVQDESDDENEYGHE